MSTLTSFKDGSLGSGPNMSAMRDGSLGKLDMQSFRDGSLGALGGGCGCGVGQTTDGVNMGGILAFAGVVGLMFVLLSGTEA